MSRVVTHTKKTISKKVIILGLLTSIVFISSSLFFLLYPFPSKEKVAYFTSKNPIIYNGEIHSEAILNENVVYLPLQFIQNEMDNSITFDKETSSIIVTTQDKVIQMPSKNLTLFVNSMPEKLEIPAMITKDGNIYVSYSTIEAFYPFAVSILEETGAVYVKKDGESIISGKVLAPKGEYDLRLRDKPTQTSPYVAEVINDEVITIEKEENSYFFVRKQNGIAGYIKKEHIELEKAETVTVLREEVMPYAPDTTWPINLTWEAVYTQNPDTSKLSAMSGVNVVSPTWFKVKNEQGEIANLGSMEYVNWAKSKNLKIWGLFSNDFNPELTNVVLQNFETRQSMIRQLLQYSEMYKLDGINIDFENVNLEDSQLVTQFVRELTPYMHEAGLVVSMDITFISSSENWSMFYERDQLANIVDYLIVMAYDEHWSTSPVAGSVASFPWVESNLKTLLETVPNDRLILGLPTYTRIWKEQDTIAGNIEVSSKAHSMGYIQNWLKENQLKPVFDEKTGQHYVEYRDEKEKATYKVWIEDADSLARRSQFVHHYKLAGVATWSRYFSSEEAWSAIDGSLKKRK
jgi:spore germination protein YaaH